jgi:GNAT superfamily N-acetyltransferase
MYEIRSYIDSDLSQVLDILTVLWGDDYEKNLSYFKWKYYENPYTENPLGIVAVHDEKIVGFRGFFALKYQLGGETNEIIVLSPGDTCVHPDHRRKGLSISMLNKAMEEYKSKFNIFLNLSSNSKSMPGYLKLGFLALAPKFKVTLFEKKGSIGHIAELFPNKVIKYVKRSRLIKYLFLIRDRLIFSRNETLAEDLGGVVFEHRPRPKEMCDVASRFRSDVGKFKLVQDETFFRWRFDNDKNKYRFYYSLINGLIIDYMVVILSPNNNRIGTIVDYSDNAGLKILRYILNSNYFDILSIYNYGISENFMKNLKKTMEFKNNDIQKNGIEGKDQLQLLVRPIKEEILDDDWFIGKVDLKDFKNWKIKPICSDAT